MLSSYALLADATANGRRASLLKTDDESYVIRGWIMHAGEDQLLLVRAWLANKYVYVVIDARASMLATATGELHQSTYRRIREDLDIKGIVVGDPDDGYSLLADHVEGPRRTSVINTDDGAWSMRVKLMDTGEVVYLQLRIEVAEVGFVHLVLHEDGAVVAFVTGATDADAWERLKGEMGRRDIDIT